MLSHVVLEERKDADEEGDTERLVVDGSDNEEVKLVVCCVHAVQP